MRTKGFLIIKLILFLFIFNCNINTAKAVNTYKLTIKGNPDIVKYIKADTDEVFTYKDKNQFKKNISNAPTIIQDDTFWHGCGIESAQNALGFLGLQVRKSTFRKNTDVIAVSDSVKATIPKNLKDGINKVLKSSGLNFIEAKLTHLGNDDKNGRNNLRRIKNYIHETGLPVILLLQRGHHYVVVTGYKKASNPDNDELYILNNNSSQIVNAKDVKLTFNREADVGRIALKTKNSLQGDGMTTSYKAGAMIYFESGKKELAILSSKYSYIELASIFPFGFFKTYTSEGQYEITFGNTPKEKGYISIDNYKLEDGTECTVLLTLPEFMGDRATFKAWLPKIKIPKNAKLMTKIGFVDQSSGTSSFRLYLHPERGGLIKVFDHKKTNDGKLKDVEIDLSKYAGQKVGIEFRVDSNLRRYSGSAVAYYNPQTVWVNPRIDTNTTITSNSLYKVDSKEMWVPTGKTVFRGQTLKINYKNGSWATHSSWGKTFDARGNTSTRAHNGYLVPGSAKGCLVGKIGQNGIPFYVGNNYEKVISTTENLHGLLYLSINDSKSSRDSYKDNLGEINVSVTIDNAHKKISPKPPSNYVKIEAGCSKKTQQLPSYISWSLKNGRYFIKNKMSSLVLDVEGASKSKKANIQQYPYHGNSNQRWNVIHVKGDYYKIVNVNSNKVLDVEGASTSKKANIQQYSYNGGANQLWKFVKRDKNFYTIENKKSKNVLDVEGGSTSKKANIQQYPYHGGSNQLWKLVPVNNESGHNLYACHGEYKGSLHPGKTWDGHKYCNIGWGGKEILLKEFEILYIPNTHRNSDNWVKPEHIGQIPRNKYWGTKNWSAGQENNHKLYICRGEYKGGIHPGKTWDGHKYCNIGWDGKEILLKEFEIFNWNSRDDISTPKWY